MRALSFLTTAGLLLLVACGGPTGPTASVPAATTSPSASAPAATPEESPGPLPTELVLGQTFGLYMDVVTPAAVPVMGPTGLLLVSCGLVLAAAYAIRRRMTLVSQ